MDREARAKARKESQEFNQAITESWKEIASKYPEALKDFTDYIDNLAAWYRYCAEEQIMHELPLDDHRVNQCLQQARVCDTVKTYITSRINSDVAQPKKSK